MPYHLREAKHQAEKIRFYHKHYGTSAYALAKHHFAELDRLLSSANNSQKGKNDVSRIHAIYMDMNVLMQEMKARDELDRSQDSQK